LTESGSMTLTLVGDRKWMQKAQNIVLEM